MFAVRHHPAQYGSISDETALRFQMRAHDPLKQWKLSPMDLESRSRWEQYTKAKEIMLERTHIPEARWWVVEADDKKRARLNCIHHLLSQVPYGEVAHPPVKLPKRIHNPSYSRQSMPEDLFVPDVIDLQADPAQSGVSVARSRRRARRGTQ
jgi:hypothetical protein